MIPAQRPLNDPARLGTLRTLDLLDSKPEKHFDRLARLARTTVNAPVGLISIVAGDRQFFKSVDGPLGWAGGTRETPLSHSFCQHVVEGNAPLVVNDALSHRLVFENHAIKDFGVRAYLGVPIHSPDGFVLGSLCVIDSKPRVWEAREVELMEDFAQIVTSEIARRQETGARRKAEAELKTVSRFQQAVLDSANFSIIAVSLDGTILSFNSASERMFGYSRDEVIGNCTPAIFHVRHEILARSAELSVQLGYPVKVGFDTFVALVRTGVVDEREWTFVRRDGSHFPALVSIIAMRDERGSITGFLEVSQDISKQSQIARALQASEDRLEQVLSRADCLIWEAQVTISANDWAWRMTVHPSGLYQRLMGNRQPIEAGLWYQFEIPEQLEMNARSRAAILNGATEYTQEFRLLRRDAVVWIRETVSISRPDNDHYWLVGIAIDITRSKTISSALEQSEERFRRLSDSSPVGIFQVDLTGSCNYVNPKWCEIAGMRPEKALGHGFIVSIHPDDRGGFKLHWEEAAADRRDFVFEFRFLRPDGSIRWGRSQATPLMDAQGHCIGYVGTNEDITEHKHAALLLYQQKFALDQHAIVAITDTKGTISYVNDLFCQISGYAREELVGHNHRMLNSGHHPREFFSDMYKTIASDRVWHADICNRNKNGAFYWVATTIVPLKNVAGRVEQYIAIRADITAQKQVEEQLKVARDQALEASRMKSEFLATMSHEIRTPMNAVIGMTSLLIDTPLNEQQSEMTRTILGGAESLLAIINDILDFSRIEAGKMRIDPVEFNFTRVVEETLSLLATRAYEKQIELNCEIQPWSESLLLGDSGRVRQILINLIGNAIKFTEKGEVLVTVQPLLETETTTRLRIGIRDTGIGITRLAQERLFQPFVQGDGSTTRKFGGTGLGLAISRQLIELMGGEIGFESEVGKGSYFWIELGFSRCGRAPIESPFSLPPGKRVLVVDDNETNRRIILAQLKNLGVEAVAVADAIDALTTLRDSSTGPWHLVLLDWQMPGLNGVDLAALIQLEPPLAKLPLVMLSSSSQVLAGNQPKVSLARFLTKPVLLSQLKHCLTQVLVPPEIPELPIARASEKKRGGLKLKLLLVEDNLANQRVATLLLDRLGCSVDVAENGLVGLNQLAQKTYDAVLMDCQMPILDGYETTRRIRDGREKGVNAKIPIIAMTAYARPEDRARCINAGMDDYVSKPIREAELAAALARCGFMVFSAETLTEPPPPATILDLTSVETLKSLIDEKGRCLFPVVVDIFLRDEVERLTLMDRLIDERKTNELAQQAHSFGGNAAALGGLEVRQIALLLESVAQKGDWLAARDRLAALRWACRRLKDEINKLSLPVA